MQIDTFFQRTIKTDQRRVFINVFGSTFGDPGNTFPLQDMTVRAGQSFPG